MDRARRLQPGTGNFSLNAFADKQRLGGQMRYEHRPAKWAALFAEGSAWYEYKTNDWDAQAITGVEFRW